MVTAEKWTSRPVVEAPDSSSAGHGNLQLRAIVRFGAGEHPRWQGVAALVRTMMQVDLANRSCDPCSGVDIQSNSSS